MLFTAINDNTTIILGVYQIIYAHTVYILEVQIVNENFVCVIKFIVSFRFFIFKIKTKNILN